MRINAITVCVNYADFLSRSILSWKAGTNDLLVVTTPEDKETIELCAKSCVDIYATNVFTANGATFNKAAALVEAIENTKILTDSDWFLFFDSDIIPPPRWRSYVEDLRPQPGYLYGVHRFEEATRAVYPDGEVAGYFALAHSSDPNMQRRPLLETNWRHAGGYDSEFQSRWNSFRPMDNRRWLHTFRVLHQGTPGRNWWGRGDNAKMDQMLAQRAKTPGFDGERIK